MIKTPESYPTNLDKHLQYVATKGLVPGKLHVSYHQIIQDLHELVPLTNRSSQVLICGGYDFKLDVQLPDAVILENRHAEQCEKANINIHDYKKIIVFSDWISGANELSDDLKFVGNQIKAPQELYVVELAFFNHAKAIEIFGGNIRLKWFQYKQWLKFNSSHMHLGYKVHRAESLRVLNLTPEY